ncbi:MAG: M14 family zinc carboxypeptidase [Bacteriovoracaceae bacterium]
MFKWYSSFLLFTLVGCSYITPLFKDRAQNGPEPAKTTKTEPAPNKTPKEYVIKTAENSDKIKAYCDKTNQYFKKYDWGESSCHDYTWHHVRNSYWGNPIVWFVFGDEDKQKRPKMNVTLVMCGVHGDEITPVKFCYDLLDDLRKNPQLIENNLVVVAPLVAPDSFFKSKPTRTNARGVDVNRNFPTEDWGKDAKRLWKSRYGSDPRRYPGKYALSEQETIFQVNLINLYRPNKIISVHSPLTLLDYDGPSFTQEKGIVAKKLLEEMSHKAGRYKISDYPFFTGSLGNWAGNENKIPTYTLELPNSDWHKTDRYYNMFRSALHHAIQHDLKIKEKEEGKQEKNRKYSGDHQH